MNYLDAIIDALNHLDGLAHISEICDYIKENDTLDYLSTNRNWKEQISNSITTHSSNSNSYRDGEDLFFTPKYGSGYWGLRRFKYTDYGYDEEFFDVNNVRFVEGKKTAVLVNSYERNPVAKRTCLKHYKNLNNGRIKCEICGFDFGNVYGSEFDNKIHIHHLVEISSIGEEYEIDAIDDLLPVCPNCHMIAHSRKPAYTPDEIRSMINKRGNSDDD